MKRILVNIVSTLDAIPNLQDLLPLEFAASLALKEKGVLENLFTKDDRMGAVLIFQDLDLEQAKDAVSKLPLFDYFEKVEYFELSKHF
jgi:muconolactone delta-isomerase